MRVLVDFHHPDLYWSFILSMERRLGWEVYRMIGMEWYDRGYWEFEKFWAGDRFAKMFLPISRGEAPGDRTNPVRSPDIDMGTHWLRNDERHPGYQTKMVTMEQARAMGFDVVIATVPHNQQGFKRFAYEIGARFALQVGNAEHYIDWDLDPLVMISTTVDTTEVQSALRKKRAIRYDQEIDPCFSYSPVPKEGEVASFHIDWNQQNLDLFFKVAADMPEQDFQSYGNLGLYLTSTPAVADAMKKTRVIWHTKHVGDGWGHVIHGAMAIGRPLIGKKSYYKDRLADRCWTPSNSLIIDSMPPAKVVRALRGLLAEPDILQRMGDASRAIWDDYIDYERDAAAIGNLLG
jgi:hypothetical protein